MAQPAQRSLSEELARRYGIVVRFGEFGAEAPCYEARVIELPDVRDYADTAEEAYALALDTVTVLIEHATERGRPLPPPQVS